MHSQHLAAVQPLASQFVEAAFALCLWLPAHAKSGLLHFFAVLQVGPFQPDVPQVQLQPVWVLGSYVPSGLHTAESSHPPPPVARAHVMCVDVQGVAVASQHSSFRQPLAAQLVDVPALRAYPLPHVAGLGVGPAV